MSLDYCVVFGCRNSVTISNRHRTDCEFFNFPLDRKDQTDAWLRKLNLEGWIPGPENVVCDEHFSLDSFEIEDNKKVLKPEAVPNIVDELNQILSQYETLLISQSEETSQNCSIIQDEELRCRICATFVSSRDAVDVFSEDGKIIEKILTCIPILTKTHEYLPKYICRPCLADLNTSYRMLLRAIESEKFFNSLLINEPKSGGDLIVIEEERPPPTKSFLLCNEFDEGNTSNRLRRDLEIDFSDNGFSESFESLNSKLEDDTPIFAFVEIGSSINSNVEHGGDSSISSPDKAVQDLHTDDVHPPSPSVFETSNLKDDEFSSETIIAPSVFTCQHCNTSYESKEKLNEHLETHVVSVWYEDSETKEKLPEMEYFGNSTSICKICFIVFPSHLLLEQHLKRVHNQRYVLNDAVQKYTCKECGKEFKNKLNFTVHERVHTGARPFVCENCGSSFRSRANLVQHLVIHTGVKKYKCAVCNKAFSRKGFVDAHMRVHTGERPFKCNICDWKFTQVGDMRRHMQKCQCETMSEKKLRIRRDFCRRARSYAVHKNQPVNDVNVNS